MRDMSVTSHAHIYSHTQSHLHTITHTHQHTQIYAHIFIHAQSYTQAHIYIQLHTHTHIYTRTHTQTLPWGNETVAPQTHASLGCRRELEGLPLGPPGHPHLLFLLRVPRKECWALSALRVCESESILLPLPSLHFGDPRCSHLHSIPLPSGGGSRET